MAQSQWWWMTLEVRYHARRLVLALIALLAECFRLGER
jgi:hypothetical protein